MHFSCFDERFRGGRREERGLPPNATSADDGVVKTSFPDAALAVTVPATVGTRPFDMLQSTKLRTGQNLLEAGFKRHNAKHMARDDVQRHFPMP